jgi:hemerythrin HHE cation binding domain-containing protein
MITLTANGAPFEAKPETARGQAIYELLLSVHRKIRRDLDRVEGLAAEALEGLSPEELRRQLEEIKRDGMLWQLQVSCLRYCRFVHLHHNAEDGDFFPELRETNPAINSVVDRLQADHRRVSHDLDAVETAANALETDDGVEARKAVVDTLQGLADNLLAHLDYEELSLQPTVVRVREWAQTVR